MQSAEKISGKKIKTVVATNYFNGLKISGSDKSGPIQQGGSC